MENLFKVIMLSPLYISAFWGMELLVKGCIRKEKQMLYLVFFMFSSFVAEGVGIAFSLGFYHLFSVMYIPAVFCSLAQFPSFYVYVYTVTSEKEPSVAKVFPHYIFPLISALSAAIIHLLWFNKGDSFLFVSEFLTRTLIENNKFEFAFIADRLYKGSFILFALFYFWLTNRRIRKHRKSIDNYFSNTENISLEWIRFFYVLFFLTLLAGILYHSFDRRYFTDHPGTVGLIYAIAAFFFWFVGHSGNKQRRIYPQSYFQNDNITKTEAKESFSLSREKLQKSLESAMVKDKLYLQPDLSLPQLAQYINTNRTYLSKFINEEYQKNFKQFVNDYRLKESENLLKLSDKSSSSFIMSLPGQCGFNSYDTFYRCFKEKYGMLPSSFYEKLHR